jgi:hypothetical protein
VCGCGRERKRERDKEKEREREEREKKVIERERERKIIFIICKSNIAQKRKNSSKPIKTNFFVYRQAITHQREDI